MAWGPGREPKYSSEPRTIEDIKADIRVTNPLAICRFLDGLDMDYTEIFYVENNGSHSGNFGYRINHYSTKSNGSKRQWNQAWGNTWIGLGAWMS